MLRGWLPGTAHSSLSNSWVFSLAPYVGNLLVCRNCGETLELPLPPALTSDISRIVAQHGFAPDQWDCVVHGLCQRCERELKNKVIPTKLIH